jgi:DNA-binding MarR family transcriptional regulator
MVKKLDETPLLDQHIGLDLWRAAWAWRDRLHAEMVRRGHAWYGDARGAVAAHLPPNGLAQSELVRRMGTTKQAVQQLLDGLQADGIVTREPDPNDRRSRRILYTARGLAAQRDAVAVKQTIESEYRARLGEASFRSLRSSLRKLTSTEERPRRQT